MDEIFEIIDYSDGIELLQDSMFEAGDQINCDSRNLTSTLLGKSSIPAVARIGQSETTCKKAFWFIVFIACLAGGSYESYRFLNIYFQYPVIIDMETVHDFNLEFPAVTICNLNNVKKSMVPCIILGKSLNTCMKQETTGRKNRITNTARKKYVKILNELKNKTIDYLNVFKIYNRWKTDLKEKSGHKIEDLVKSCFFNSIPCSEENFTYHYSTQLGNCWTFKETKTKNAKAKNQFVSNLKHGLELDLSIEEDDYLPITAASGIRVEILSPDDEPNPEEFGFNISPGFETYAAILKHSFHRLPAPYRDQCREYASNTVFKSQTDCIRKCIQSYSLSHCECVDPFLPRAGLRQCDLKNSTQMKCLDRVADSLKENGLPCECPLSCYGYDYKVKLFSNVLYSKDFCERRFMNDSCDYALNNSTNIFKQRNSSKLCFDEDKARLKVFYQNYEHTIYHQRAMLSESELYAHIGGNFGLWLGLSFVSLAECIENAFYLIHLYLNKTMTRKKFKFV